MTTPNKDTDIPTADDATPADPSTTARRRRPTIDELRDRELRTDRLWEIEDVATFLVFSVRQTEKYVKRPGMPQPRLVAKSGERRWAPSQWIRWMDETDTWYADGNPDMDTDGADGGLSGMGAL